MEGRGGEEDGGHSGDRHLQGGGEGRGDMGQKGGEERKERGQQERGIAGGVVSMAGAEIAVHMLALHSGWSGGADGSDESIGNARKQLLAQWPIHPISFSFSVRTIFRCNHVEL